MEVKSDEELIQHLLAHYIKNKRKDVNISQDELCNKSEVSVETISRIENGKTFANLKTFFHLVVALDIDANALIAEYKAKSEYFNR